jgi:hypothetical protein
MTVNLTTGHKICQEFPLQDPTKFTQIGIFLFENKPSGNPVRLSSVSFKTSFYLSFSVISHFQRNANQGIFSSLRRYK